MGLLLSRQLKSQKTLRTCAFDGGVSQPSVVHHRVTSHLREHKPFIETCTVCMRTLAGCQRSCQASDGADSESMAADAGSLLNQTS